MDRITHSMYRFLRSNRSNEEAFKLEKLTRQSSFKKVEIVGPDLTECCRPPKEYYTSDESDSDSCAGAVTSNNNCVCALNFEDETLF